MAYQRFGKPNRHYVWMGDDGLHIMHNPVEMNDQLILGHGPDGVDNAKAVLRGLVDLLAAEGVSIEIRRGSPIFGRKKP